jgi:hypothetical protein
MDLLRNRNQSAVVSLG